MMTYRPLTRFKKNFFPGSIYSAIPKGLERKKVNDLHRGGDETDNEVIFLHKNLMEK